MDASEKLYADYELEVTDPGGHSSLPTPENAIYRLAAALVQSQNYRFPFELNDVTRAYFERTATVQKGQVAADMIAVATRLQAGHANNALTQRVTANVSCRILPGHSRDEIRKVLAGVIADPTVTVRRLTA